ncbi:hypothetical protein ACFFUT_18035 [Pseudohalocynthiibacter aestuariivivens]|jgi:hypothetical protein|uniref:Uncharacterized protein n=1 Tax=Pseudohalocynthiibacter aestuariivivens TaxID=1591409 RepID=A0ABV5JJR3_9RHOB|nr:MULTISPECIES: hypothetical protein [Pseudohalocynthiibacter]
MKTKTYVQRKAPKYGTGFESAHTPVEPKVFSNWYDATNRLGSR